MTLKTPWPICATCKAIPPAFFRPGSAPQQPYQLWPKYLEFAESAARGCHACTLLYEAVREPFKTKLDVEPLYLESAIIDNTVAVVLTVNLDALPENSIWVKASWKRIDGENTVFKFVTIADVKFLTDAEDIPQGFKHFKGKQAEPQAGIELY